MAKKKTQGKLAKYENALPGEPGDLILPLVAIIEGGVRFPMDPLLANFLDYFNLSPTQISFNIFRIVMGVVKLNRQLDLNLTVHDIIATYTLRTSQSEAYSLRPRNVFNTLVNSLPDTNKDMTDDYLLVRGAWHHPNHRCPTRDERPGQVLWRVMFSHLFPKSFGDSNVFFFFHATEERKKPQSSLTNLAAVQIVYDSERTKPLLITISDICSGINIKRLLPLPRVSAEASGSTPPGDLRKRKRKGSSKGETSRPEPQINPEVSRTEAPQSGADDQPPTTQPRIELDPDVPSQGPGPSKEPVPLWAPSYEVFGDPVRSDAIVLKTGGAGSNTASALSEVARLPTDMALKREETEETLYAALEANTRAEKRIKALEAEATEREKAAFAWGRVEAEAIMTNQLPDIYNEAFEEGWRALLAWPESEELPPKPPQENLPYLDAPIGFAGREGHGAPASAA
uniref:Uncharacterized protein n=1 Tax=Fagus sylvatica TaxID=28930 RepID=A0A2N9IVX2_FAGSY